MDIRDFQGLFKYKIALPIIYSISWIAMIVGPLFFEETYQKICIIVLIYANIKVVIMFIIVFIIIIKSRDIFKRVYQSNLANDFRNQDFSDSSQEIYYGFIVPNYNEDIELIAETLNVLASHTRSKEKYLIFLAMEACEDNSDYKAEELIKRFRESFKAIEFTRHEMRQYEQKGKASNVSWCAENLEPFFEKYSINPNSVLLTILNADSWAPNVYFDIMEEHVLNNYVKRHTFIYQPPQIFTRNHMNVPTITRVYDLMHSFGHCSNLFSIFNFTSPLSNYTLSYNLIKRIGFWDTCPDAIGEDFHTTQKAYWKTGGEITTVPIYTPFNQVNTSTGNGFIEDIVARFWQAERHAQGASDVAWEFKMLFANKFRPMNIIVWFKTFESYVIPGILPWMLISLFLQINILYLFMTIPKTLQQPIVVKILFNVVNILSIIVFLMYEYIRRKSNTIIYKRQNEAMWRIIEFPMNFVGFLFLITVPASIIAVFGSLWSNRKYFMAEKKNASHQN